MGGSVAGKSEVLFLLANDFVANCCGYAISAKAADGKVIAITDQSFHCIGNGSDFIGQCPWLITKSITSMIRMGISKEGMAAHCRTNSPTNFLNRRSFLVLS